MKRFVIAMLVLGALALGAYYLYYFVGFYLPGRSQGEPDLPFRAEGKELLRRNREGGYESFEIRGVEVSASLPGHYASDFAPDEEDYLRWFEQIGDLGANTVKAPSVMNDDFYNALYEYNRESGAPLYLLQVIPVTEAVKDGPENAFDESFQQVLIRDGKKAVDVIHGRKSILAGSSGTGGRYRRDVSRWVIGLVIGDGWSPDTVAYTDHSILHGGEYRGTYFSTTGEAGAFEAMLAQVMDEIAAYETEKYGAQRPLGFANGPDTDFLEYREEYAVQLQKYSYLDAEHILGTESWRAGTFAAYRLYDYCEDFADYLSQEQQRELGSLLAGLNRESSYGGYLELLSGYHTMPVLAVEYGFSTARGAIREGQEPLTEREQGERLMKVYRDAADLGWSGVCISSWQDRWDQKSWNTAFAVESSHRMYWHDLITDGENYGLLAFEPEEESVCTLDGQAGEWSEEDQVLQAEGMTLSLRYDSEALYLLIEGDQVGEDTPLLVPFDTLEGQGSLTAQDPVLTSDREMDFILSIDGRDNTRLLVQERYEAVRENFSFEMSGVNPFVYYPEKDSDAFLPIETVQENMTVSEDYLELTPRERREQTALGAYESGLLRHGNGDPQSEEYDSLADFMFGEGLVELRIPWLLLNVGDPAYMQIHEDYYENYGVEFTPAKTFWLGLTAGTEAVMEPVRLKGTGTKPSYREREKESCQVIRQEWRGGSENASAG